MAEIAERAGLTKRTFFRYFDDKREVLFSGAPAFQDAVVAAVVDAPEGVAPIDAVVARPGGRGKRTSPSSARVPGTASASSRLRANSRSAR